MFYNNMGVIHYAMNKPNLACHYFRQALKEDQAIKGSFKKNESKFYYYLNNVNITLLIKF